MSELNQAKKEMNHTKYKNLLKKRRKLEIQIEAGKRNRKKKSMRRKSNKSINRNTRQFTRRKSSSDDMKFFVNELVEGSKLSP